MHLLFSIRATLEDQHVQINPTVGFQSNLKDSKLITSYITQIIVTGTKIIKTSNQSSTAITFTAALT